MFDIIGKRRWFFALSLAVTIPGLLFILGGLINPKVGLQFAIDFTGGTVWTIRFEDPNVNPQQVKDVLAGTGIEANVTETGTGFMEIRTKEAALAAPAPTPTPAPTLGPSGSPGASSSAAPSASTGVARRCLGRRAVVGAVRRGFAIRLARSVGLAQPVAIELGRGLARRQRVREPGPRPRRRRRAADPGQARRGPRGPRGGPRADRRAGVAVLGRRRRVERPDHPGPDPDPRRLGRHPALDHVPLPRLPDGRHGARRAAPRRARGRRRVRDPRHVHRAADRQPVRDRDADRHRLLGPRHDRRVRPGPREPRPPRGRAVRPDRQPLDPADPRAGRSRPA